MKRYLFNLTGVLAVLLALMLLAGCATASSIGSTADRHGLISKAKVVADGQELASYSVIMGLVDSGYEEYAATVRQAEAKGQKVTTVTTSYIFFAKIVAYTK